MDILYLEWSKVDEAIWTMCDIIRRDYDFDVIVGISRGGLIPAVRISHIFDNRQHKYLHEKLGEHHGYKPDGRDAVAFGHVTAWDVCPCASGAPGARGSVEC